MLDDDVIMGDSGVILRVQGSSSIQRRIDAPVVWPCGARATDWRMVCSLKSAS
jgi:hypothetical protein